MQGCQECLIRQNFFGIPKIFMQGQDYTLDEDVGSINDVIKKLKLDITNKQYVKTNTENRLSYSDPLSEEIKIRNKISYLITCESMQFNNERASFGLILKIICRLFYSTIDGINRHKVLYSIDVAIKKSEIQRKIDLSYQKFSSANDEKINGLRDNWNKNIHKSKKLNELEEFERTWDNAYESRDENLARRNNEYLMV